MDQHLSNLLRRYQTTRDMSLIPSLKQTLERSPQFKQLLSLDLLWEIKTYSNLLTVNQGQLPEYDYQLIETMIIPEDLRYINILGIPEGGFKKWIRKWHFPNQFGVSCFYDITDPIPGMAPQLPVPFERHQMEAVAFVYEPPTWESSPYQFPFTDTWFERPDACPPLRRNQLVGGGFFSRTVSRFKLTEVTEFVQFLQLAANQTDVTTWFEPDAIDTLL